jgi:hypothetical protein
LHTFITDMIKVKKEQPLAVAQYCGTSLTMIQKDYCGTLGLASLNRGFTDDERKNTDHRTKIKPQAPANAFSPREGVVAGPGFEPGTSRL